MQKPHLLVHLVCFLWATSTTAQSQNVDPALLGLWAIQGDYCKPLWEQGDLTDLNPVFDHKYVFFSQKIFYSNADTPYYISKFTKTTSNTGFFEFSNEITNELGRYEYKIRRSSGNIFLELRDNWGETLDFSRCK